MVRRMSWWRVAYMGGVGSGVKKGEEQAGVSRGEKLMAWIIWEL